MNMGGFMHIVMIFVMIGVLFNFVSRPQSWGSFLNETFGALTGVTSSIAKIQ